MDLAARLSIALVWLYNGLWCKVLARDPSHRDIVASAADPLGLPADPVALAIGVGEIALAIWVVSGRTRRACAWTQTGVLVAMNAAGLAFGSSSIASPGGVVVHNIVPLTLAWLVAARSAAAPHV